MANIDFQSFVDEVVMKNDIVEIISGYTTLKRSGNNMMGLCPLHNDKKSPSLSVSPDKQIFHCFGCGAGGSVIQFVEAAMNLDFMDALKFLAERVHMEMPTVHGGDKQKQLVTSRRKERMYELNVCAARYYHERLNSPEGREGMEYLNDRKVSASVIKRFGIGFAPRSWTSLVDHLKTLGYTENEICDAGLAKRRDNGSCYDAFYDGRIIFPIIDVRGKVIAFGGRIIYDGTDAPKYWNSPETLVFKKKDNLFGLNLAKNDKSGKLLLMEGYMDVVALHQSGFGNAVASLGTAFTPEQARLLKRYAPQAVLCYDNDEAGKKATLRAGDILFDEGVKVRVLTVTDGKDPDEFIKKKGPEMFGVLIERSKPLIEYKIDEIREKYNNNNDNIDDKVDFLHDVSEVLVKVKNLAQREMYISRIAEELKISTESIAAGIAELEQKENRAEKRRIETERLRRSVRRAERGGEKPELAQYSAERLLLSLMTDKKAFDYIKELGITPEDFTSSPLHGRLAEQIFETADRGARLEAADIIGRLRPEDAGGAADILMDDKSIVDKIGASRQPAEIILAGRDKRLRGSISDDDTARMEQLFERKKARKL